MAIFRDISLTFALKQIVLKIILLFFVGFFFFDFSGIAQRSPLVDSLSNELKNRYQLEKNQFSELDRILIRYESNLQQINKISNSEQLISKKRSNIQGTQVSIKKMLRGPQLVLYRKYWNKKEKNLVFKEL
jgi:hypothetical protein